MNLINRLKERFALYLSIIVFCGAISVANVSAKESDPASRTDYAKGQQYLDQQEWRKAANQFDKIIKKGGKNQDAALYWKAYSQSQNSEYQNALSTLNQLSKRFPKSNWIDDARALTAEIKDQLGEASEITDDEMKLYAINSLLSSPSERSVEVLAKIIKSDSSDRVKKRAIFVLSQSSHSDAYQLMTDIAMDKSNPALQLSAIETLGMTRSERTIELLKKVYKSSEGLPVKRQVLKSFMIAGEKTELLSLAKSENQPELQKQAIRLIGVMRGNDELMALYQQQSFAPLRAEIINAIAIGGGADQLIGIVKSETDSKLVVEAVKKMGIINRNDSGKKLLSLYQTKNNQEVKSAVIQALFIQNNAKGLISIVKSEQDNRLKRKALKRLSMINSDEVIEFFSQSIEQ